MFKAQHLVRRSLMVGEIVPNLELPLLKAEGESVNIEKISLAEYLKDKKTLLVGHPGAFTRFTTLKQLPDYTEAAAVLKEAGVDQILFTSVNDQFVMAEYFKRTKSQFAMLADWNGKLAEAFQVELPAKEFFSRISRRYVAYIEGDLRIIAASCEQNVQYTERTAPKRVLEILGRLRS